MIKFPEVKRHSVDGYGRQDICYNDPYGEFVYYEDYANLRQDLDRLQAEVQRLNAAAQPVSDGYKVPEGWKLVPVVPTDKMINAALGIGGFTIRSTYTSMISAAPASPGGQDD
ncbi:hypothetical protein ACTUSX_11520 [Pantoea ananatis]|uniref:hypothetical protein n=1 Tax=Pantoea ananas TaxID=553 RepID=UPI003FA4B8EE